MEKTSTKKENEEMLLNEAEMEIRKNTDELLKWLGGTVRYLVCSIKGLSELSKDKKGYRSYVTERLLANIECLSEIADIYGDETTDCDDDNDSHVGIDEKDIAAALFGQEGKIEDLDDLYRFYAKMITTILAVNREEFLTMRLHISAIKFINKAGDAFGSELLGYICDHILRTKNQIREKRIANMLCLVMAIKEVPSELLGGYAEVIESIIDHSSLIVCMSVTNDYINNEKNKEN